MKWPIRIPWFVGLAFGVIFVLELGGVALDFQEDLNIFQTTLRQAALTTTMAIAQSLDNEAKASAWQVAQDHLRRLSEQTVKFHVRVIAPDGLVLADSQHSQPGGRLELPLVAQALTQSKTPLTAPGDSAYRFFVAVSLSGPTGQPVAVLLNEVDWADQFSEAQSKVLMHALVAGLSIIVVSGVTLALVWALIVWPLERLRRLAEAVMQGADKERAPTFLTVELQQVGAALNQMLDRNAAQQETLTRLNLNLATAVAQRTQELEQANTMLRESEATLRQLSQAVEQSCVSIVITDINGDIEYVNPKFTELTGYTLAEVKGQNPRILKAGQTPPEEYRRLWQTITAGEEWRGEFQNKKKNGELYWESASISPITDTSGKITHFLAIKEDITERKQLETQLLQAQKLEAIGRLAGGVAHDFNNVLTAMMGYIGLILRAVPANDPMRGNVEGIQKSAERAANLTHQLLAFARKQVIEPKKLGLNELVLNVDKMLRRLIGEDIELITLLAPDLGWVKADPGQLEQVLLNLGVNARDAMPDGGKLTIRTANIWFGPDDVRGQVEMVPGEYVRLTVSDTGVGMTEEVKAHLFEPFFTTKEMGKGTGLGLATCFGIVKQNNGHIWVESEPGQGATFKIYLPRVDADSPLPAGRGEPDALPVGRETILLVEDELRVRELAALILRQQGYRVLVAGHGEEALRLAEETETQLDLLLTDVVMPRLGGKAVADQLKARHPHLKVLFTSGYTGEILVHHGILEPGIAFLPKPFSPTTLAVKVREVLDS